MCIYFSQDKNIGQKLLKNKNILFFLFSYKISLYYTPSGSINNCAKGNSIIRRYVSRRWLYYELSFFILWYQFFPCITISGHTIWLNKESLSSWQKYLNSNGIAERFLCMNKQNPFMDLPLKLFPLLSI